jgi:2-(3-amino-3-carboxypropyl)histidine synthase
MLEQSIARIKASGARKIFVQAPEGLKTKLQEMDSILKKAGLEPVLSCEPCFGACDLRDSEAKRLGCELLLHIGHRDFGVKSEIPVIYEEYTIDADPAGILKNSAGAMECCRLGLVTTVQYSHLAGKATSQLESMHFKVMNAEKPILGCDQSAATALEDRVDAFLFMGTGRFHALGLLTATKKPVFFLDLENKNLSNITKERERLERIKFANVEKARDCKNFGILVSTKPGQAKIDAALDAKKKLEGRGKHAWILAMDTVAPEKLLGLKLDCLVNCACPRLTEDAAQFRKPVINPEDLDKL